MHPGDLIDRLRNLYPARQHGDIGNERHIAHEPIALAPRVASQHRQLSLIWDETENGVQRSGLAGPVWTDEPKDAPLLHPQIDAVQRDCRAEDFAEVSGFYACHGFSSPPR